MSDEQIKDIIVALIEKGQVYRGTTNEETGKNVAELYISMRDTIDKYYEE